jgi:DNA polymerase kappa
MNKESNEFISFNLEEGASGCFFANKNDTKDTLSCRTDGNDNVNDIIQGCLKPEPEEKRAELVTHKAGFDKVDQTKVNEILKKLEENSSFGRLKAKKDAELQENIREQRWVYERLQAQDLTFVRSRVQFCINTIEQKRDLSKYIVCIDMDAYYASVEERDDPTLVNRPMGVGDSAMLCTANYTARKFGVRSGMPGYFAKALCPQIVIVKPNFDKYTAVSQQIRTIFARYDPNFSAMSLDEAFLDITGYVQNHNQTPEDVVQQIRNEIHDETKLTASAGIAANKLLAKVCADVNKPNGQYRLANDKDKIIEFLRELPVRKICGIGQVAAKILNGVFDIHTCGELLDKLVYINMMFSENSFNFYMRVALGIGSSGICIDYIRKSVSTSRTFAPTNDAKLFYEHLRHIAEELARRLDQENLEGKTIAVIFKMQTFEQFTRQKALTKYISLQHDLYTYCKAILDKEVPISLRLLGIRITNLRDKNTSSVKSYFAIKEDVNRRPVDSEGQIIDALNTLSIPATNPVRDSLKNHEMLQLQEDSKGELSRNEQSSQQVSLILGSQKISLQRCNLTEPLHKTPQFQQCNIVEDRDTGLQGSSMQCTPESQRVEQNDIFLAQHISLLEDNMSPMAESQKTSLNDGTFAVEITRIDNEQSQNRTPTQGDIANLAEQLISDDFENELADENVESRVDSNTRKRALEDAAKSSTTFESLALKRRLINDKQGPTLSQAQVNDNETCKDTNVILADWNCPICNRHFDNPTLMRINSHFEACRAPRFPNTKINKINGVRGRRGRGRGRHGSPHPTVTLHNFFTSSHLGIH